MNYFDNLYMLIISDNFQETKQNCELVRKQLSIACNRYYSKHLPKIRDHLVISHNVKSISR